MGYSVKPILLLRVSNNDLFLFFFLAGASNVCVANAMFVFRFVSKSFGHVDFFSSELLSEQQILLDQSVSCVLLVAIQCRVSINSELFTRNWITKYYRILMHRSLFSSRR